MIKRFFNQWLSHKPPDRDINALREQAIKIATEEALSPNSQGVSFLALAKAELSRSSKDDAATLAELERHLSELTDVLGNIPPLKPVTSWSRMAKLGRFCEWQAQYRHKRALANKIRRLKYQIAFARRVQRRRDERIAENMAVVIGVYQLQLRRAQAAVKVAYKSVPPVVAVSAAPGDNKPEERKQPHEIRIAAAS